MATYYRIHSADEAPETVLDVTRPDGWVASDEDYATQPHGVSACASLGDLIRYCQIYGLAIQPGDVVLRMTGRICDEDRDQHAVRVEAESYEVVGSAERLVRLVEPARRGGWEADPDRVDALLGAW